jgi:tripartite-type tricarboxylate transporter receptor subunit TctC
VLARRAERELIKTKNKNIYLEENMIRSIIGAAALCMLSSPASAADDFFRDKRVTILVNYAAGGPTDIEARLLMRYLPNHLAGVRSVIVQNMDGAGGITGTNYLGEVAPKDGTMFGYLTGTAFQYAMKPQSQRVDYLDYNFIAYQPGTAIYFMRADIKPGLKVAIDVVKGQNIVSGGLGVDNAKDILLRLTLDMLGVKYGYVTSYKGSAGARNAFQIGEVNFYSESPPSYRAVIQPQLVEKGEAIGVYYDPNYDGEKLSTTSQTKGLDILPFHELYAKIYGKQPEGELWDIYKSVIALNGAMQRLIVMPPGAPKEAVEALRVAVGKLNTDKDYAEAAVKTFGFVPEWTADPSVAVKVRKNLVLPAKTHQFLQTYIDNPPKNR